MRTSLMILMTASLAGCATLTEDAMTPIAFSFSDGGTGECHLTNKRGAWSAEVPSVVSVRKSDDALKYQCTTKDGREAVGSIESEMGAKIVASAVFLDLGITDAITDKHRKYVESYVIPVKPREGGDEDSPSASTKVYTELQQLEDLRKQGIITDGEFAAQKKKILDAN